MNEGLKRQCMANVNNTNVYIGKSKNESEWSELSPLKFLVEAKLEKNSKYWYSFNDSKKIGTKCFVITVLNLSTFLFFFFFITLYAIHIHWNCAKQNKTDAEIYIKSLEFLPTMLSD